MRGFGKTLLQDHESDIARKALKSQKHCNLLNTLPQVVEFVVSKDEHDWFPCCMTPEKNRMEVKEKLVSAYATSKWKTFQNCRFFPSHNVHTKWYISHYTIVKNLDPTRRSTCSSRTKLVRTTPCWPEESNQMRKFSWNLDRRMSATLEMSVRSWDTKIVLSINVHGIRMTIRSRNWVANDEIEAVWSWNTNIAGWQRTYNWDVLTINTKRTGTLLNKTNRCYTLVNSTGPTCK